MSAPYIKIVQDKIVPVRSAFFNEFRHIRKINVRLFVDSNSNLSVEILKERIQRAFFCRRITLTLTDFSIKSMHCI